VAPRISWVNSIRKPETHSVDAPEIIERTRDGQWNGWITEVRAGTRAKDTLPAVFPSGTFSSRNGTNGSVAEKLIQHSGLLCADLDKLGDDLETVRGLLNASKYVCASFVSPSGDGLKAWFYVLPDAVLHAGSFRAVEKYVLELTGKKIDPGCKDVGRLCFISDDPGAYYNPNRCELAPLPEPEKPP
jgi:VirE-like protein